MGHFLGGAGAAKLLTANQSTPAVDVAGAAAAQKPEKLQSHRHQITGEETEDLNVDPHGMSALKSLNGEDPFTGEGVGHRNRQAILAFHAIRCRHRSL